MIELLVVIGIVAILAGLLVVAMGAARERARATVCQARIRQLSIGLDSYDAANGRFPHGFEMTSGFSFAAEKYAGIPGSVDLPGRWWFDRSEKVNHWTQDGLDVLACPSKRQDHPWLDMSILCGNYAANMSILKVKNYPAPYREGFAGLPLSSDQIRQPGQTLLLADGGYSLISWWHVAEEPPVPLPTEVTMLGGVQHAAYIPGMSMNRDRTLYPGQTSDAVGGRHPQKTANVGFADGHVARSRAEDMVVRKIDENRWDCGPLWQSSGDYLTPVAAAP